MQSEFLELIGFTPEEGKEPNIEDVRNHVNKTFVAIDQIGNRRDILDPIIDQKVNKTVGGRLGKLQTAIIKNGKELGLEIAHSDFENKPIEEVAESIFERVKTNFEDLKKGGKTNEEYEKKIQTLTAERDTFQSSLEQSQNDFLAFKDNLEKERVKSAKKNSVDSAFNSIKWTANTPNISKTGLRATFDGTYDVEIENDTTFVVDRTSGNRVQNPKNAAKMLTVAEAMEALARKESLWSDSPDEGKPAPKRQTPAPQTNPSAPGQREVSKRASAAFLGR